MGVSIACACLTLRFGDATTTDKGCFPFFPDRFCLGFQEVLSRYCEITPNVQLSGPTNFAPVIRGMQWSSGDCVQAVVHDLATIEIVKQTQSYHILIIVADGQVSNEADTRRAIIEASYFPMYVCSDRMPDDSVLIC